MWTFRAASACAKSNIFPRFFSTAAPLMPRVVAHLQQAPREQIAEFESALDPGTAARWEALLTKAGPAKKAASFSNDNVVRSAFKSIFHQYDADGNGVISKSEFTALAVDYGLCSSAEQAGRIFVGVDTDSNLEISFEEFLHFADQLGEDFWEETDELYVGDVSKARS